MITYAQRKALERGSRIAHKLPRTKAQREAARKCMKKIWKKGVAKVKRRKLWKIGVEASRILPRTRKQLKNSRNKKHIKKMHRAIMKAMKHKNGRCGICKKRCFIHRDHNHKTGKKRGKLCAGCNLMLGKIENPKYPSWIRKVKRYLRRYQ